MSELSIPVVLLIGMIFLAAFQQTISGFGFSLVVMPIATSTTKHFESSSSR